jgi:hypothetical protein
MSLSALCFQPSRHAGCCGRNQSPEACQKNTGDLQWKSDAVCNVRPCADEIKAAGARTMDINGKNNGYQWKNNANNNGTITTFGCVARRQAMGLCAHRY